jgi:Uma2 family endonuclease
MALPAMNRTARGHWTYQSYLRLPEGEYFEIVRGERVMTPAPVPDHQIVCARIVEAITRFVRARKLGLVLFSPIDVVLAEDVVFQPDILFIAEERRSIVGEKAILGAPDLVIEIASPATADLDAGTKKDLYGRHGVREYWIVDAEARRVSIFVLEGDRFEERAAAAGSGEARSLAVLPGLAVPLADIFS